MNFHYIDDVIDSFIAQIEGISFPDNDGIFRVKKIHPITLGQLADTLIYFQAAVKDDRIPEINNETEKTLYTTYISYVEKNKTENN